MPDDDRSWPSPLGWAGSGTPPPAPRLGGSDHGPAVEQGRELAERVRRSLRLGDGPLLRFPELLEERFQLDVTSRRSPRRSTASAPAWATLAQATFLGEPQVLEHPADLVEAELLRLRLAGDSLGPRHNPG